MIAASGAANFMKTSPDQQRDASLGPRMALDLVPPGDDSHFVVAKKTKEKLPEGVTSKAMYKDILHIAWPSFIELMLTQLASMVDLMMVGNLGSASIAAVGITNQPKFLMMTMFQAMNVGATALVARHKGAGERERANLIMRQALVLTLILSVIGGIVVFLFAEPLVHFMGATEAATLAGGTDYLRIQALGIVTVALTSTITASLRGAGNSRTAMLYNLTANIVNVIFNYLLIYGHFGFPRMEVAGASLATVIGQAVAMVLAFLSVMGHRNYVHLSFRDGFRPQRHAMISIFNIGIPAMVEQIVMRVGVILYSKTVASLGTVPFATHQVCMNIQALSFMNGQAFAVSATSLMGQSLGKKRPDMAEYYTTRTRRLGMSVSILIMLVFILFGGTIVGFYNDDPQIVETGSRILMFVALIQPFQSSQFILAGSLRGAGDTKATAVITLLTVLCIRPPLAMVGIHVLHWGLYGAWVALVVDQLLRSLLVWLRFVSGKWKKVRVI